MKRWVLVLFFLLLSCAHADRAQLKRGADVFKNYCSGCHALQYMREARLAYDLGLSSPEDGMDFTHISMPASDARRWFGRMPPDLSLTARVRGRAWLTAYLKGFYPDASRPFGTNNQLLPWVGMPNVFAPMAHQGALDGTVEEVVSFLEYVAEPARLIRYRMGICVIFFLCVVACLLYQCKRSFESI